MKRGIRVDWDALEDALAHTDEEKDHIRIVGFSDKKTQHVSFSIPYLEAEKLASSIEKLVAKIRAAKAASVVWRNKS
jgi:hypothetical protein